MKCVESTLGVLWKVGAVGGGAGEGMQWGLLSGDGRWQDWKQAWASKLLKNSRRGEIVKAEMEGEVMYVIEIFRKQNW